MDEHPVALVDLALRIALDAHEGQADTYGRPYILHALRVGLRGRSDTEIAAGLLHDVVEDSPLTLDDLRAQGVPADVLAIVDALSKRPEEELDYDAYIDRVLRTPAALPVKLADLEDNMDLRRVTHFTEGTAARLARYRGAWERVRVSMEPASHP
jgi:(p)ppGpp synthase/HD superfamily hydrolase